MYADLQEKSTQEPWKTMKADAISRSNDLRVNFKRNELNEHIGAAALAYILDEKNAKTHAVRVRNAIGVHVAQLRIGTDWDGVVPPMGGVIYCYISS